MLLDFSLGAIIDRDPDTNEIDTIWIVPMMGFNVPSRIVRDENDIILEYNHPNGTARYLADELSDYMDINHDITNNDFIRAVFDENSWIICFVIKSQDDEKDDKAIPIFTELGTPDTMPYMTSFDGDIRTIMFG